MPEADAVNDRSPNDVVARQPGHGASGTDTTAAAPELKRALGFRDLLLFYISATFSLRWIATAAAAGPSALAIWIIAALCLFVPLVYAVLELSGRYPEEGGVYVWSKRAFGPFSGFMTGWMYWATNLPYYPALLYFCAGNILYAGGPGWQALSTSSSYFITVSTVGLVIAVVMNIVGLNVGKWLSNLGAFGTWASASVLIVLGVISWSRFGSATAFTPSSLVPSVSLKDVIFWSTIAYAFGGVESASTMGEEIRDPRRTVPRAIFASGVFMTAFYLVATTAILLAIPREQVSGLQGFMQGIDAMAHRIGTGWIVAPVALLVAVSSLGGVNSWFAATARIPFVAGIDRFLPPAFGRLHPRWQTPYVAIVVQAVLALVFIVLGQSGTTVKGAYEALVSMSIVSYFLPFLYMFAALIVVQREPAPSEAFRVPGGPTAARAAGAVGFATTVVSIVLACIPSDSEPDKALAVIKVVGASVALVLIGAVIYALGTRRISEAA